MAYAEDLLQVAEEILNLHPEKDHQASLRRAVSTAYYALFHLLITDAVSVCSDARMQAALRRIFDHGQMKSASFEQSAMRSRPDQSVVVMDGLRLVADTFCAAQIERQEADYNLEREWFSLQVATLIERVKKAFRIWSEIRTEPEAREYLNSMLSKRERRVQAPRTS